MDVDGNEYSGEVKVFAKYLDPSKLETLEEMPGDLTGVDSEGNMMGLTSFGMLAVELTSQDNNEVYLPVGEKARITMPVPADLLGHAPETIPLWHFDEEIGTWLEEGSAQLVGDQYVGEVEHFSFWNCDYPYELVNLKGFVVIDGIGGESLYLKVTDQVTGNSASCCLLYTSPSPRDKRQSRMPSSA